MEYCEDCGTSLVKEFDYRSDGPDPETVERNGQRQYAVRVEESMICRGCVPEMHYVLREGTAYWSPESYNAEAEPDEIVWDKAEVVQQ